MTPTNDESQDRFPCLGTKIVKIVKVPQSLWGSRDVVVEPSHDWGKWSDIKVEDGATILPRTTDVKPYRVPDRVTVQYRACMVCNLVQRYRIRAWFV